MKSRISLWAASRVDSADTAGLTDRQDPKGRCRTDRMERDGRRMADFRKGRNGAMARRCRKDLLLRKVSNHPKDFRRRKASTETADRNSRKDRNLRKALTVRADTVWGIVKMLPVEECGRIWFRRRNTNKTGEKKVLQYL